MLIIKNLFKKVWEQKYWDDLIVLVIIALSLNAFWPYLGEPKSPIDPYNYSILKKIDSLSVCLSNPSRQRSLLITILQERMAIDSNSISTSDNIKMQIRLFYAAILTGITSFIFIKDKSNRIVVATTLFTIITLMYLLEIHRDDLYKRQIAVYTTKGIAVDSLVNLSPQNMTWYILTNKNIDKAYKDAKETRIPRKILAAFKPDPEQLLFYFAPFSAIYLFIIRTVMKSKIKKRR